MFSAAPVPRPPQPIKPTLIVSLPAAWALPSRPRPIVAAVELFKKSRREADDAFEGDGSVMVLSPDAQWDWSRTATRPPTRPGLLMRPVSTDRFDPINACLYP